jgi:superfamily II DNA helicase RecQ
VQLAEQTDVTQAARVAAEEQEHRKDIRKERLRQMQEYADTSTCQREHLLRYFDDEFTDPATSAIIAKPQHLASRSTLALAFAAKLPELLYCPTAIG